MAHMLLKNAMVVMNVGGSLRVAVIYSSSVSPAKKNYCPRICEEIMGQRRVKRRWHPLCWPYNLSPGVRCLCPTPCKVTKMVTDMMITRDAAGPKWADKASSTAIGEDRIGLGQVLSIPGYRLTYKRTQIEGEKVARESQFVTAN